MHHNHQAKEEIVIHVIDREGKQHDILIPPDLGLNIMEVCAASGLPIISVCGGMALCGGCHAYVLSDHQLNPRSAQEEETLDKLLHVEANSRLCCQIQANPTVDGLTIMLAPA